MCFQRGDKIQVTRPIPTMAHLKGLYGYVRCYLGGVLFVVLQNGVEAAFLEDEVDTF